MVYNFLRYSPLDFFGLVTCEILVQDQVVSSVTLKFQSVLSDYNLFQFLDQLWTSV